MTSLTTMVHGKTAVVFFILWDVSNISWPPGPLAIRGRSNLDIRLRALASSQAKTVSVKRVCTHPAAGK